MNIAHRPTGASLARHRSEQDVGTPDNFLRAVVKRFGPIAFDLAATAENDVAAAFFPPIADSLIQDWTCRRGTLWLNPPFGNIAPWARKCRESAATAHAFDRILLLVPASVGSRWFAQYIHGHAMVVALTGRLTFKGHTAPFPKDLILASFGEFRGFDTWAWRDNVLATDTNNT